MSFHYSFIDESTAHNRVYKMCEQLLPGGYCILITLYACKIVARIEALWDKTDKISSKFFSIKHNLQLRNIPPYRAIYVFFLRGSAATNAGAEDNEEGLPEYLIRPSNLAYLFKQNGMELVERCWFQEYYKKCIEKDPEQRSLFYKMMGEES